MPHSFASPLVHVVFPTKDRVSDLSPGLATRLFRYMAGYIAAQREHHRQVSFQEEFLSFPRKHGIAYDTRDLWG